MENKLIFDPLEGITIIDPPGDMKEGCWAGASSIMYDDEGHLFYLTYRLREPRPKRGYKYIISQSEDGRQFTPIWHFTREQIDSDSMEKGSLIKLAKDDWKLYISYVHKSDNKWRIDVVNGTHPASFDIAKRTSVLTSQSTNSEGVKDPVVILVDGTIHMYYTFAHKVGDGTQGLHDTGDVLNTGLSKASTGLAISKDGINFNFNYKDNVNNCVLSSNDKNNWDWYCTRITSIIKVAGINIAYYDGAQTVAENYEEKLGISVSLDLYNFTRLSEKGPVVTSPFASQSIRYVSALKIGNEIYFYYEFARQDGSHELRFNKISI